MPKKTNIANTIRALQNKLRTLKVTPKKVKRINRRRKRMSNMSSSTKPVTTMQVTKNVQNAGRIRPMRGNGHPYGACRLNPFSGISMVFAGLPDGDNSRRIVIDHVGYSDFTISSGQLTIRCVPALPYTILVHPSAGSNYTMSDPTMGSVTVTAAGSTIANTWTPMGGINAYSAQIQAGQGISNSVVGPYSQTKARCIGFAWRVLYTGTVANASGLLTMRDFGVALDDYVTIPAGGIKQVVQLNNATPTALPWTSVVATVDFPSQSASNDIGNTRFLRLDQNPWGVLKHNSQIYSWKNYREQPFNLISTANSVADIANSSTTLLNPLLTQTLIGNSGINIYDSEFNCTEIKMSPVLSTTSFRLETRSCWEYIVQPTSPVYSLTKAPPAKNLFIMEKVDTVLQKSPPALAFNESLDMTRGM